MIKLILNIKTILGTILTIFTIVTYLGTAAIASQNQFIVHEEYLFYGMTSSEKLELIQYINNNKLNKIILPTDLIIKAGKTYTEDLYMKM